LIYLDAVQSYSYDAGLANPAEDPVELRKKIERTRAQEGFFEPPATLRAIYEIYAGEQKYKDIRGPVLAIAAVPGNLAKVPKAEKAGTAAQKEAQVTAFLKSAYDPHA